MKTRFKVKKKETYFFKQKRMYKLKNALKKL